MSVTWYTWLEQGRGGSPSAEVLARLARALELDAAGREIMLGLARRSPPPVRPTGSRPVAPVLQRVLDAMPASPALVMTRGGDVVAWNAAATVVLANVAAPFPRVGTLAARNQESDTDIRGSSTSDDLGNQEFGIKRLQHPVVGPLTLDCSAFSVEGRRELRMIVYTPASSEDARAIGVLLSDHS